MVAFSEMFKRLGSLFSCAADIQEQKKQHNKALAQIWNTRHSGVGAGHVWPSPTFTTQTPPQEQRITGASHMAARRLPLRPPRGKSQPPVQRRRKKRTHCVVRQVGSVRQTGFAAVSGCAGAWCSARSMGTVRKGGCLPRRSQGRGSALRRARRRGGAGGGAGHRRGARAGARRAVQPPVGPLARRAAVRDRLAARAPQRGREEADAAPLRAGRGEGGGSGGGLLA